MITPSAGASRPSIARWEKCGCAWIPSSVNVPSSISSAIRSRAVSLPASCWRAIRSSPPPSRARARRSCRSSASERRRLVVSGSALKGGKWDVPLPTLSQRQWARVSITSTGQGALRWTCSEIERRSAEARVLALVADHDQLRADLRGDGAERVRRRAEHGVQVDLDRERRRSRRGRRRGSPGRASAGSTSAACALTRWSGRPDEPASSAAWRTASEAESEPSVPVTIAAVLIAAGDATRSALPRLAQERQQQLGEPRRRRGRRHRGDLDPHDLGRAGELRQHARAAGPSRARPAPGTCTASRTGRARRGRGGGRPARRAPRRRPRPA